MNTQITPRANTEAFLAEQAIAIHALLKRSVQDIAEIGARLLQVKESLGSTKVLYQWCQAELGISASTVERFMNVARFKNTHTNLVISDASVLYELAAPGTPEQIIEDVQRGYIEPTLPAIREAKREAKGKVSPARSVKDDIDKLISFIMNSSLADASSAVIEKHLLDMLRESEEDTDMLSALNRVSVALYNAHYEFTH